MLARIAHELFWLGRNVARAEHTARMLEGIYQADLQGRPDDPVSVTLSWGALLAIMGAGSQSMANGDGAGIRDRALSTLTLDADNQLSVISCVGRAREGARTVRDVISRIARSHDAGVDANPDTIVSSLRQMRSISTFASRPERPI